MLRITDIPDDELLLVFVQLDQDKAYVFDQHGVPLDEPGYGTPKGVMASCDFMEMFV